MAQLDEVVHCYPGASPVIKDNVTVRQRIAPVD
jgi:hypothetical protein